MITAKIPYPFLVGFCHLTWRDIEFGLTHNYISPEVAIDFSCSKVGDNPDPDPSELAIGACAIDDPILERVKALAARDSVSNPEDVQAKWLCFLLAWLYENRGVFEDPLAMVEEIYVDFDYPEEIAHLIRYMPSHEPDLGSKEANLARLVKRWGEFVTKCRAKCKESLL